MTDHQAYSYTVKRIVGEMITLPAVAKEPGKKYTISVETFPEKYTPKRKGLCGMGTFQVLTDLRSGNVFMSEFILNSHFLFSSIYCDLDRRILQVRQCDDSFGFLRIRQGT